MSALFSPLQLGPVALANRLIVAPMCQYSADHGSATDWHTVHLGSLALSGAGLVILEATGVEPEGRITPWCLGLYSDENEAALGRILKQLKPLTPIKWGIQLAHAGRKASSDKPWLGGKLLNNELGWKPIAPSAIALNDHEPAPAEMSASDMARVKSAFIQAAQRAVRLGFDVIELHGAHGYLLHEFMSPVANQRTDAYGGTLENRMRFPLEVFDAVKAVLPSHVALGMRISATDWITSEPSWDIDQSLSLANALEQRGCDFIHVSSGGISQKQAIQVGPGYQLPFAQAIKAKVRMPVIAVGMITEPQQAENVLTSSTADAVALARAFLYNPRWGWHAATQLGGTVYGPQQYWRCLPKEAAHIFGQVNLGQR